MFAEQVQVWAAATGERWWRRLCLASFVLAGITALLVWVAVAELLRQGHLGAVLSAGRAELAAPLLAALVVGTGINALHHSQEELSVLTSFRAHPLMHTTGFLLATIPVVALMPARPIAPVLITIYGRAGGLGGSCPAARRRAARRAIPDPGIMGGCESLGRRPGW
jgi:hypothetical protein